MIDVKATRARIAGWRGAFEEKLAAFDPRILQFALKLYF